MPRVSRWAVVLLVVAGVLAALPEDIGLYLRAAVSLVAAGSIGIASMRGSGERPIAWYLIAAGELGFAVVWAAAGLGSAAYGGWADGLGLASAALMAVALYLSAGSRRDRMILVDGGVIAAAMLVLCWAVLYAPTVDEVTSAELLLSAGYLTVAVVSAALLAVGMSRPQLRPTPALWTLFLAVCLRSVGIIGWSWRGVQDQPQLWFGRWAWLAAALLIALVAPSRESLVQAVPDDPRTLAVGTIRTRRLLVLAAFAILPGVVVALVAPRDGAEGAIFDVGIWASMVAMALLLWRVWVSAGFALEDERAAADVRLGSLVHRSSDVVLVLAADGTPSYVTPSIERVLRYTEDDLVYLPFEQLVEERDRPQFHGAMASLADGVPVDLRLKLHTGDGRLIDVEGTVADLRDVADVGGVVVTIRDVSSRVALEAELTRAALRDPLTGLANRALLIDRVRHALSVRHETTPGVAVLFVDLDDFKIINDGMGHAVGDDVLRQVAGRMSSVLRDGDTAARVGGDEFAIVLEDLPVGGEDEVAHEVAERVIAVMEEPFPVVGRSVRVRCAIGIAIADQDSRVDQMMRDADTAMYAAKRSPRPAVTFDAEMHQAVRRRLELVNDLEDAIRSNRLLVVYQPIIDLQTRQMVSVEALLRWTHPELGPIPPPEFIGYAERSGLIGDLTRWVLSRVARDMVEWQTQHGGRLNVAVNFSATQFTTSDLVSDMDAAFGPHGIPLDQITIELTETTILEHLELAARTLAAARERGARVAIDDFGTGYASLGYLRRLPVDTVKIDRAFIVELDHVPLERSFASLIQLLASRLGLATVAEGIETPAHEQAIRALGCGYGQGWLYAKPMPIGALPGSLEVPVTELSST